jgi:hypothetical protein
MKKITCAVVFLSLAAMAGFGQAPAVLLQNQDVATFYYVIDPAELEGLSPGSPLLASRVAAFFSAAGGTPLSSIAPDERARLADLAEGTHLLVGFFAVQEEEELPVRVISLQVDSNIGDRFYAIFASPAQLSVPRGVGKLAGLGREAAAAAAPSSGTQSASPPQGKTGQATAVPGAATAPRTASRAPLESIEDFSASFDPGTFTREKGGELVVLPVSQSRAWDMTGTRITAIAGARDAGGVHLSLTVPSGFTPNVSYFLYVFGGRTLGQDNAVTLELVPPARGDAGACLVWRRGEARPGIIGTVTTSRAEMTVDIGEEELQALARESGAGDAAAAVSFDLTAGWHDTALALWEEFFYTTFSLSRIAVTR